MKMNIMKIIKHISLYCEYYVRSVDCRHWKGAACSLLVKTYAKGLLIFHVISLLGKTELFKCIDYFPKNRWG